MDDIATFLPAYIPLKWVFLLVPLFILLTWHHYQHLFFQSISGKTTSASLRETMKALRSRSLQIAAVWVIAIALVIYADIRYYRLAWEVEEPGAREDQAGTLEPLDFKRSASQSAAAPSAPQDARQLEARLDEIKFRYEDAFVSYFYLRRCKAAGIEELNAINAALTREVRALGADPSVQYSIYSAAQGSYESIYADTSCKPDALNPVLHQFKAFVQKNL